MNTQTKQFSRQDYLAGVCTHREYYSQFVNPTILSRVAKWFGTDNIKKALQTDDNLNNISLSKWDGFVQSKQLFDVSEKMKLAGDYLTLAGGVCIAKEAAKQLSETKKAVD